MKNRLRILPDSPSGVFWEKEETWGRVSHPSLAKKDGGGIRCRGGIERPALLCRRSQRDEHGLYDIEPH